MNIYEIPIERHPWKPFIPSRPVMLMLGSFPPKPERWSMEFYYPNRTNDFWKIAGFIFDGEPHRYYDEKAKRFRLDDIKSMLEAKGIALWDAGMAVRRLKDNASDKFLEIVETIDLERLLDKYPTIVTVVTTGEKATSVIAEKAGVDVPPIGVGVQCRVGSHLLTLWRVPSSSRAYPLSLERKADAYRAMFQAAGML